MNGFEAPNEPQTDKKLNSVTFDEFVRGRPKELLIKIGPLKVKNTVEEKPCVAIVSR